jgi:hypothetical protein
MKPRHAAALALLLAACAVPRHDIERSVVVGVGSAVEVELPEGTTHTGTNVFVEYDAIKDWLELELGVSLFPQGGGVEVSSDFLFKKPFRLTEDLECNARFRAGACAGSS